MGDSANPTEGDPRIQQLVDAAQDGGVTIEPVAARATLAWLDAMLERNRSVNLTAIRDPQAALWLHALDSLQCAPLLPTLDDRGMALDIGSGNGFPGAGIAALRPNWRVHLLERTAKKARSLGDFARVLNSLPDRPEPVQVVHIDATQAPTLEPELTAAFDVVTARAVAAPQDVAKLARPFLRDSGRLLLWLDESLDPPKELGKTLRRDAVHEYRLPTPPDPARTRRIARYVYRG